jgi:hypothetical protein
MLGLLIIVSAMETCPKIAPPRPPVEGRQLPRLAIEANKLPIRGLFALIALFAHLKLALLRLFTIPSVSHRDLVRLIRFVRTFLQAPLEASVPRDNCLMIALQPFTRPTPRGCQVKTSVDSAAGRKAIAQGLKPVLFSIVYGPAKAVP